jgi:hypothetical protein
LVWGTAPELIARPLPLSTAGSAIRLVRALGAHRYVAGRLIVVHALAFDAVHPPGSDTPLVEAVAWAAKVLADPDIDAASKDERLFRAASPDEVTTVLEAFWTPGKRADEVHERLMTRLESLELDVGTHPPFDADVEDDVHPCLIDAGWELHPLASLDPEKHRGAIEAFDEPILFEAARFEEENAIPPLRYLQELPAFGPVELLRGVDPDGNLLEPLVLWTEGNDVYQDYVLRGALRAAKVE